MQLNKVAQRLTIMVRQLTNLNYKGRNNQMSSLASGIEMDFADLPKEVVHVIEQNGRLYVYVDTCGMQLRVRATDFEEAYELQKGIDTLCDYWDVLREMPNSVIYVGPNNTVLSLLIDCYRAQHNDTFFTHHEITATFKKVK